jgi:hypothetical protein
VINIGNEVGAAFLVIVMLEHAIRADACAYLKWAYFHRFT